MNDLHTIQVNKEPIVIPDRDDFGEKFPREYAPSPTVKPGVEPVIIPPMPKEEEIPEEAVVTNVTQEQAQAAAKREAEEFCAEEEVSYIAYMKKHNLPW